jgi:hypothetical protein
VSEPRSQSKHQYNRNKLKRIRVFGKKPKANQQPAKRPLPGEMRAFFHCQPKREHCSQPEKNRQRINRHQERTDVEDRGDIQRDDRPHSGGRVE